LFFTRRWKPPRPHLHRDEALNDLPDCDKICQKKRRAGGVLPLSCVSMHC
jgi:hypothetical protein